MAAIDRPPVERAMVRMASTIVALLLAIGGLSLGGVALERTANVGQCINDTLGERAAPSAQDAAAHVEFAQALNKVLVTPPGPQQQAAFAAFQVVVDRYSKTLQQDQEYRDSHPLGKC